MTDEPEVALSVAGSPIRTDLGVRVPRLVVRCREGTLDAFVDFGFVVEGSVGGEVAARVRLDERSPEEQTFTASTDLQGAFASDPDAWLTALLGAHLLRVEVQEALSGPRVARFSLDGLRPLAGRLGCRNAAARRGAALGKLGVRLTNGTPTPGDGVYFEFQVEQPAVAAPGQRVAYPEDLRASRVRGETVAQFVVDTVGRVEPDALKILRTDHERFAAAVRDAVKTWRFRPATIAGRPVRQLVQLSFTFTPPR